MAEDVLADWKRHRFAVVDARGWGMDTDWIVVLSDISFWAERMWELNAWCEQYGCNSRGMTVEIPTDHLLTLFQLRWS